jgi:ribosomal protein S17E
MDFIGPSSQKDTTANEVSASALRCQAARHKKRLREDIKGYITKAIDPNIRIYLTIETNR